MWLILTKQFRIRLPTQGCFFSISNPSPRCVKVKILFPILNVKINYLLLQPNKRARPEWLSWLEHYPHVERLPFRFLVRAHTCVLGSIPSRCVRKATYQWFSLTSMFFALSLSLSLLASLPLTLPSSLFKSSGEG